MKIFFRLLLITIYPFFGIAGYSLSVDSLTIALKRLHETHRFNGVLGVVNKGLPPYSFSAGYVQHGTSKDLTANSTFLVPGFEQPIATLVILQLIQDGKIDLTKNCKSYFSGFPYEDITIHHLLYQQSGLPDYKGWYKMHRRPLDTLTLQGLPVLIKELAPPLLFPPGTDRKHSLTNDLLLVLIAEKVSGKKFELLVNELIFKPWKMTGTQWRPSPIENNPGNFARSFFWENDQKMPVKPGMDDAMAVPLVYSSTNDLLIFASGFYKILEKYPDLLEELPNKGDSERIGLWKSRTGKGFIFSGSRNGFDALIQYNAAMDESVVMLNNCNNFLPIKLTRDWLSGLVPKVPPTALIMNVQIADGTGTALRKSSVRIEGKRILDVGNLKPFEGEPVTDGHGKILAPGFIDTHSHLAGYLPEYPEALAALNQGITTIISGQDGNGEPVDSLNAFIERQPIAINLATYTGHTSLRRSAMGEGSLMRPASQTEIKNMQALLKLELQKGSLGLSTGLEYEGAFFSHRNEVIELAKTTSAEKGRYMSHIRSEDISMHDAIDEIIDIGRIAKLPVLISHIKLALKDDWGTAPRLISTLQKARAEGIDITADCYPYDFWNSTLRVLFPNKNFSNPAAALFAAEHLFDPEGSVLVRFAPDTTYRGKTISTIAKMRGEDAATTLMNLVAMASKYAKEHPDASGIEAIMGKSMSEEDIIPFLSWSHTNICSDGGNGGHPRGYGSFTRVLNRYVKELKIMSWETAIHKMTGLAAEHAGIRERGFIAPGYFADLVLIDPETVKDNANIEHSKALSDGIIKVWVNGTPVYADKVFAGNYPGVFVGR